MNHRRALRRHLRLALIAASVFAIVSASASAQTDKSAQHARLIELQAQYEASKGQPGADAQQLAANRTEFAQISASLGGDLPCATGNQVSGNSASRAPAPSPTGCVATTTPFANTAAVAIPTGQAVVTSTITVAGAAAYLWDVDLTTFITHTFNADLDITLQSPAGTVVTITTDNGVGNDNVFNGTVWDDDANPLGQVPYTSNNGLVTDHVYADLALASPLVPEEALAAFVGENPNGVWTLTISDDRALDGGSLDQWSLNLTTFAAAPTLAPVQSFNQTTAVTIPATAPPNVVTSTLAVAGLTNPICKAVLRTNITHTFAADLDITLLSPGGTIVTLTTDNGGGFDNVFAGTVWDDDANPAGQVPYVNNQGIVTDHLYTNLVLASPLVVEESMGAFMGEVGNGTWTLTISDDANLDGGSLVDWGLDLITCACAVLQADLALTQSNDAAGNALLVGNTFVKTLTVTNNGPGAATAITVTDTLPPQLQFVSSNCGATATGQVVTYTIPALASGAVNNCALTLRIVATGTIINTATITASTPADPNPANNTTTAQIGPSGGGIAQTPVPALDRNMILVLLGLVSAFGMLALRQRQA